MGEQGQTINKCYGGTELHLVPRWWVGKLDLEGAGLECTDAHCTNAAMEAGKNRFGVNVYASFGTRSYCTEEF